MNPDGTKRLPDTRLTFAEGFSINPSLAWTGTEFVVVWQDDGMGARGNNEVFGQRIDLEGRPIGGNVRLVDEGGADQTSPIIAAGGQSLGVVWLKGGPSLHRLMFASFDSELRVMNPGAVPIDMASGAYPVIVHNASQYVVAWYDADSTPKTVYGAVRDDQGKEIVAAKPLIQTSGHARYPALLPYGDRILLVWSDDRDQNSGYELYMTMLDQKLDAMTPATRLTYAVGDSIDAVIAAGSNGTLGILFGDDRTGSSQVYFLGLGCKPATR